jgi:hypothetical protein
MGADQSVSHVYGTNVVPPDLQPVVGIRADVLNWAGPVLGALCFALLLIAAIGLYGATRMRLAAKQIEFASAGAVALTRLLYFVWNPFNIRGQYRCHIAYGRSSLCSRLRSRSVCLALCSGPILR